jgi:hypothetical protein
MMTSSDIFQYNTSRLRNPTKTVLKPNVVNEITIDLPEITDNTVLKIQHHCTPWRIIHQYLYTNNRTIIVPVVCSKEIELAENRVLATVVIMPTFAAFANISQGKL